MPSFMAQIDRRAEVRPDDLFARALRHVDPGHRVPVFGDMAMAYVRRGGAVVGGAVVLAGLDDPRALFLARVVLVRGEARLATRIAAIEKIPAALARMSFSFCFNSFYSR